MPQMPVSLLWRCLLMIHGMWYTVYVCIDIFTVTVIKQLMFKDYQTMSSE